MALDPDYVSVDERSVKDLLAFTKEYAKELKFYNAQNREAGDWSAFLGPDIDLNKVAVFIDDPAKFTPAEARQFFRPNFVLFLTFLKLIGYAQQQLNTLTRRHLDFYYQQILQMREKPAVPDQVNILFEPAGDVPQILLPAGTPLTAKPDSQGQDRIYRTDREIVVNHAQVAKLSSVHVHKRITGIREAREGHDGSKSEAFMQMLQVALGDPLPVFETGAEVDYDYLVSLQELVDFVRTNLFIMDFSEFRDLMRLKHQRDQSDTEWKQINETLEKAGKKRVDPDDYQFVPQNPRDFNTNLRTVLGLEYSSNSGQEDPLEHIFDGITEVKDVYDAYHKAERTDLKDRIKDRIEKRLYLSVDDFKSMIQCKIRIDNEWQGINRILEEAGKRKGNLDPNLEPPYTFPVKAPHEVDAFADNLEAAVGTLSYPSLAGEEPIVDLNGYNDHFRMVETYFFTSAENFSYLMSVAKKLDPTSGEWDKVYDILEDAHKKKVYEVYEGRKKSLQTEHKERGFESMIHFALGEDPELADPSPLKRLEKFIKIKNDYDFLEDVSLKLEKDAGQVTDKDWDRVYGIVEIAQRVREGFKEPIARKEEWRNLYPSEDATAVAVTLDIDTDKDNPRWKTFGQQQTEAKEDSIPPPSLGWAISSPLLALSEGERTIILTLGFPSNLFDKDTIESHLTKDPFLIEISTEKGWISPDSTEVTVNYPSRSGISNIKPQPQTLAELQFTLTFGPDIDAIVPLHAEEALIDTRWPVLKIMLRQIWDSETEQFITHYPPFKDLVLVRTQLNVSVEGLTTFQIQNDETVLDAKKPFEPFGTSPSAGSRFFLGHPELVYKRLDSLTFNMDWMGVPEDLKDHYSNYEAVTDKSSFTTRISLIDNRLDLPLNAKAPLFTLYRFEPEGLKPDIDLATGPISENLRQKFKDQGISFSKKASVQKQEGLEWHIIEANQSNPIVIKIEDRKPKVYVPFIFIFIKDVPIAIKTVRPGYEYERATETVIGEDLLMWNRYLQWELNAPDFQHGIYPALATQKSMEMAAAIANDQTVNAADYQVNPPYTPKIKRLSLDYTSSEEIVLKEYRPGSHIDRIFHIHPFGYNEVQPDVASQGCFFLPQYDNEGELYIGIKDVQPPQNLSILFQMAEGSADPDQEPVPIQWSYLSDNRWISLHEGNILSDSTRGLINSGIIKFKLEPVKPSTRLPKDLYWIRAAVAQHSNGVCDTVAIHTQAVSATFLDKNNAPDHYSSPLPAKNITGLAEPMPEIASVRQPYTSYGAKMKEQDNIFYTRVSERLRHKNRALTLWDYERLVLERFSQIYKVKCLLANVKDHKDHPAVPGKVEIIIIPDIRDQLPSDPFEPKASAKLIADIESYLSDKSPAFATVKARNAHYVSVKVRVGVRFKQGYDEGYYKTKLNDELNRFLSPWAYEEGKDIVIGGKIYANSIINFIDERDYVDYVAKIKLFSDDDLVQPTDSGGYFVTTEGPDGVLVAARQHEIDIIPEVGYEQEEFTGIGYMKIELDFIVG